MPERRLFWNQAAATGSVGKGDWLPLKGIAREVGFVPVETGKATVEEDTDVRVSIVGGSVGLAMVAENSWEGLHSDEIHSPVIWREFAFMVSGIDGGVGLADGVALFLILLVFGFTCGSGLLLLSLSFLFLLPELMGFGQQEVSLEGFGECETRTSASESEDIAFSWD